MSEKSKINPLYFILTIILIISLAIFFTIHDHKKIKQLHQDYKKVDFNNPFIGVISDTYITKGASFLTFITGEKIFLPVSVNYLYEPSYLDDNLQIGDTLFKNRKSDTIFIKNHPKDIYFVLGDFINKK